MADKPIEDLPGSDLAKLQENLDVVREKPEQLIVAPDVSDAQIKPPLTENLNQQKINALITRFQNFIGAAEELQDILGEQLKDYTVTVDPRLDPSVRDAIRRLFGQNSSTITYEMFRQVLRWRSQMLAEGRKKTYGAWTGIAGN